MFLGTFGCSTGRMTIEYWACDDSVWAHDPLDAFMLQEPPVAMPGAPSSFLFLVVRPGGCQEPLVGSFLLVVMPGAPSRVLPPSSDARSP